MVFSYTPLDPLVVILGTLYAARLLILRPVRLMGFLPLALSLYVFVPFVSYLTLWRTIPLLLIARIFVTGAVRLRASARPVVGALVLLFAVSLLYALVWGADAERAAIRALYYASALALFLFAYEMTTRTDPRQTGEGADTARDLLIRGFALTALLYAAYGGYQIVAFYTGLPVRGIVYGPGTPGLIAQENGLPRINALASEPKRLGYVLFVGALACFTLAGRGGLGRARSSRTRLAGANSAWASSAWAGFSGGRSSGSKLLEASSPGVGFFRDNLSGTGPAGARPSGADRSRADLARSDLAHGGPVPAHATGRLSAEGGTPGALARPSGSRAPYSGAVLSGPVQPGASLPGALPSGTSRSGVSLSGHTPPELPRRGSAPTRGASARLWWRGAGLAVLALSVMTFAGSYALAVGMFLVATALLYPIRVHRAVLSAAALLAVVGALGYGLGDGSGSGHGLGSRLADAVERGYERRLAEVEIGLDGQRIYRQEFFARAYLAAHPAEALTGVGVGQYYDVLAAEYGPGVGRDRRGGLLPLNSTLLETLFDLGALAVLALYGGLAVLIWRLRQQGEVFLTLTLLFLVLQSLTIVTLLTISVVAGVGLGQLERGRSSHGMRQGGRWTRPGWGGAHQGWAHRGGHSRPPPSMAGPR